MAEVDDAFGSAHVHVDGRDEILIESDGGGRVENDRHVLAQ